MPRVVITGRGIIAPNGNSVTDYLDGLRNNVSGIGRISWPGETDTFWFAPVRDFEATDWMDAKVADGTDLFAQWALAATEQARIDAGLDDFDSERTGVVHGTSMGGTARSARRSGPTSATAPPASTARP